MENTEEERNNGGINCWEKNCGKLKEVLTKLMGNGQKELRPHSSILPPFFFHPLCSPLGQMFLDKGGSDKCPT
jgi:hypothetical protein